MTYIIMGWPITAEPMLQFSGVKQCSSFIHNSAVAEGDCSVPGR